MTSTTSAPPLSSPLSPPPPPPSSYHDYNSRRHNMREEEEYGRRTVRRWNDDYERNCIGRKRSRPGDRAFCFNDREERTEEEKRCSKRGSSFERRSPRDDRFEKTDYDMRRKRFRMDRDERGMNECVRRHWNSGRSTDSGRIRRVSEEERWKKQPKFDFGELPRRHPRHYTSSSSSSSQRPSKDHLPSIDVVRKQRFHQRWEPFHNHRFRPPKKHDDKLPSPFCKRKNSQKHSDSIPVQKKDRGYAQAQPQSQPQPQSQQQPQPQPQPQPLSSEKTESTRISSATNGQSNSKERNPPKQSEPILEQKQNNPTEYTEKECISRDNSQKSSEIPNLAEINVPQKQDEDEQEKTLNGKLRLHIIIPPHLRLHPTPTPTQTEIIHQPSSSPGKSTPMLTESSFSLSSTLEEMDPIVKLNSSQAFRVESIPTIDSSQSSSDSVSSCSDDSIDSSLSSSSSEDELFSSDDDDDDVGEVAPSYKSTSHDNSIMASEDKKATANSNDTCNSQVDSPREQSPEPFEKTPKIPNVKSDDSSKFLQNQQGILHKQPSETPSHKYLISKNTIHETYDVRQTKTNGPPKPKIEPSSEKPFIVSNKRSVKEVRQQYFLPAPQRLEAIKPDRETSFDKNRHQSEIDGRLEQRLEKPNVSSDREKVMKLKLEKERSKKYHKMMKQKKMKSFRETNRPDTNAQIKIEEQRSEGNSIRKVSSNQNKIKVEDGKKREDGQYERKLENSFPGKSVNQLNKVGKVNIEKRRQIDGQSKQPLEKSFPKDSLDKQRKVEKIDLHQKAIEKPQSCSGKIQKKRQYINSSSESDASSSESSSSSSSNSESSSDVDDDGSSYSDEDEEWGEEEEEELITVKKTKAKQSPDLRKDKAKYNRHVRPHYKYLHSSTLICYKAGGSKASHIQKLKQRPSKISELREKLLGKELKLRRVLARNDIRSPEKLLLIQKLKKVKLQRTKLQRHINEDGRKEEKALKTKQSKEKRAIATTCEVEQSSSNWVRRSVRQPCKSALDAPPTRSLLEKLRMNDPDMVVLKLKKYIGPDTPQIVMNAVLNALMENSNCQALYIQNFNEGMHDDQVLQLARILQTRKNIWCLNIGETYNVKTKTWDKFAKRLKKTHITHMYASEHTISAELKDEMREIVRGNRTKHDMHINPENLDVIIQCTHCWWNPINAKKLRPFLKAAGKEHILYDRVGQGLPTEEDKQVQNEYFADPAQTKTPKKGNESLLRCISKEHDLNRF